MKKILIILLILTAVPVFARDEAECDENFFVVVPVPVYTPETQWAIYVIGAYIFRTDHKDKITPPSLAQISLAYTQMQQSDVFLELDHYWKNSEYSLKAVAEYKKYPDKFFEANYNELASFPPEYMVPYEYTLEFEYIWLEFYKKIFGSLFAGVKWFVQHSVMQDCEYTGDLPGSEGGFDNGLGLLAKWDTRDSVYYPMEGSYCQLSSVFFGGLTGSSHDFIKWDMDLRHYFKFDAEQSVSVNAALMAESGRPPFYFLNMLGGEKVLRGYYKGKYRGRCVAYLQAEYKHIFFSRFAASINAGLGTVEDEILKFSTGNILWSAGLGLKFFIDEKDRMTFRADLGFGRDDMGLYLVAGEAF